MKIEKKIARKNFDGSNGLFESCWREYRRHLRGAIDNPTCQADIDGWLNDIASEKVNNPASPYYIYG